MASGRPVIYSGDDEGSRLVEQIGAGTVTPPGDPVALAEAIRKLIRDPAVGERQGDRGRRWVLDNASWHRLVGDWLVEIDEITGAVDDAPGSERKASRC